MGTTRGAIKTEDPIPNETDTHKGDGRMATATKGTQMGLGIAPKTLKDKMKSEASRRVVNLTTSQLKKQGRRVREADATATDATATQMGLDIGLETERNRVNQNRIDTEKQTRLDTAEAIEKNANRKSVSEEIETENERMTYRQKMEAQHGKDGTERTGSSVRVLNRIALYEVGHGLNGGGTRKEVKDAAQWQSEFPKKGNRAGTVIGTSYNNRDFTKGPKGSK